MFAKCSRDWVLPNAKTMNSFGKFVGLQGNGGCIFTPPPSASNTICRGFHEKIKALKLVSKMFKTFVVRQYVITDKLWTN